MTLRELRTLRNWTQEDLAKSAGVSLEVIVKMERGKGNGRTATRFDNCKKVADALGITLDGLWGILANDSGTPKSGNNALKWAKEKGKKNDRKEDN